MSKTIERICLSCGKVSLIKKGSYTSNYCRPCSLKIENRYRHMSWEQIQKLFNKEYERGIKYANKVLRKRLLSFMFDEFPFIRKIYKDR